MAWRKWIVRGVVYGIVLLCGGAALAYQRWTNPAAVREQVIAKLQELFPGAQVSVDSARLRILGGIQLNGLRFSRRDDPEHNEFLQVPSAVFYHDKEKLLDGELALRKIELHQPRLRIRRTRDGKLNLAGLTRPLTPDRLLPTVVVHQGVIQFEDLLDDAAAPLVEVGDVNITLINDPLPVVSVRGAASSVALGKLQVQGTLRRAPVGMDITFHSIGMPISTPLVRRLGHVFANAKHAEMLDGLSIDALADAHGEVAYQPDAPLYYDLHCTLHRARVRHPRLPLPLDELGVSIHCTGNRLRLRDLSARSGDVEIAGDATGTLPALDQDFEAHLEVKHLELCEKLCECLPAKLIKVHELFKPHGPTAVSIACARRSGEWCNLADGTPTRLSLRPEDVAMCCKKFAYPVKHLTGTLDYSMADRRLRVDLAGLAGAQPVLITGSWQGEGKELDADFEIRGTDIPIDETLLTALPQSEQKLARSFRTTGKADIKAHVRHTPGTVEFRNEYHVRVHDATVAWEQFPCPFEQVRCLLDIYPKHWEFRDFHGVHHGGSIEAHGRSIHPRSADGSKAQGVALEITGRNVLFDDDLRKGLTPRPKLLDAWDRFRPKGRLNFVAVVHHPSDKSEDLDVRIDAQGCAIEPVFFPFLLHDIGGQFHYHNHRLDLAQLKAWHGGMLVTLGKGSVDLPPGGGYYLDFADLEARDLRFDEDLLKALPGKLQEAARSLRLRDKVQGHTRLVVRQDAEPGSLADVYWEDCQAWFKNASVHLGLDVTGVSGTLGCVGRYNGRQMLGLNGNILLNNATVLKQPLHDMQIGFQVQKETPDMLLAGVRAPMFGGDMAGQVRVEFNSTVRYELNLTASQIDLKQFGRHNLGPKSELDGIAVGRLHLNGLGTGIDSLDGHGSIDVPTGRLYNLPLLLDLLKFLGLHWPDRTLFEELHALFGVHGNRVQLRKLDLLGSAISLSGTGEANLDGSDLQVDFYPTWRIESLLPPAIRPVPPAISKSILTIEMRGKISEHSDKDLKFNKRWVPILMDPVLSLQQRLSGSESRIERKD
jgi:hypothetical protein